MGFRLAHGAAVVLTMAGCGSRTGLLSPIGEAPADASIPSLGPQDATFTADAAPGGLIRVLVPSSAPEGIYQYGLAEFDPRSGGFSDARTLSCIATVGDRPIALASACDGTVYIQFFEGALWVVDPDTLDCAVTPFDFRANRLGSAPSLAFGIDRSSTEHLYVVAPPAQASAGVFGTLDRSTFRVTPIGELTTGALVHTAAGASGAIYVFDGAAITRIDDATGATTILGGLPPGTGATTPFVVFDNVFYFFAIQSLGTTDVRAWAIGASTSSVAAQTSSMVVAAGVSPCAR